MHRSRSLVLLILLVPPAILADQSHSPQTAEYCGDCHRAIYEGWKRSAHATAMESRLCLLYTSPSPRDS